MSVLHFDKNELGNLEYSLRREMLSTNRAGGYMSTTMVCCNTRKYHGLVVCPRNDEEEENYVLLSSVDETIVQHDQSFNLAIHRFPGVYEPRGHKYIIDFDYTPTPTITYRVGGVTLKKAQAVPRIPLQPYAHPREHGGRHAQLPRPGGRAQPPLRRLSVALPADRYGFRVRRRTRLVL